MAKLLRCTDEDCESHKDDNHIFNANVTLDDDGTLAENTAKIEGRYFECVYCNSEAKWIEVK